ncbi:MAG TPA: hypothetical protein VIX19_13430 [Terriglobales bacterium]
MPFVVWSSDWRLVFGVSQPAGPGESKGSLWQVPVKPGTGEAAGRPGQLTPWNDSEPIELTVTRDGKRLSFLEKNNWEDVYLAGLGRDGASIKPPRRLTLDNRGVWSLDSWTPDSQAVIFSSARNGRAEVFRRGLSESIDEVIVRGPESYRWARVTADGSWMLYVGWTPTAAGDRPSLDRLMRRPLAGGPPGTVLEEPEGASVVHDPGLYVWDYKCPQKPYVLCVLGEEKGNDLDFYSLDPVQGKGSTLAGSKFGAG